jgi:hypothetical protein
MQTNIISLSLNGHRRAFTVTDTARGIITRAHRARLALATRLGVSPLAIAVEVSRS